MEVYIVTLILVVVVMVVVGLPRRYFVYALLIGSFCFVMGDEVSKKILTNVLKTQQLSEI